MFAYLRKEHALSAAQLLGGERAQQQHRAACRVQALARGRRARVYVAGKRFIVYCMCFSLYVVCVSLEPSLVSILSRCQVMFFSPCLLHSYFASFQFFY